MSVHLRVRQPIETLCRRARTYKSRSTDHPGVESEQVRLGQLDQLQERIGELEERVDFAERILAKQREGERLGLPQD
jgi:hypothetical protein